MNEDIIASATNKLELLNIVLHETSLERSGDIDPLAYPPDITQQGMLSVKAEEVSYESKDEAINIFRTYVNFGLRAVHEKDSDDKDDNVEIYFTLEATYRIDYNQIEPLSDEEADEFSKFNSVHNAWPFWRQHVFETVRSADLPRLQVPLMRGMIQKKKKKLK